MLPKRLPSKGLRTPLPFHRSEESSTSTKKQNGPFCSPFRLVYRSPPFKPDLNKNRLLQNKRRKKIQLFLASGRSGKWRRHGCLSSQLPLSNIDERASVWKHRVPSAASPCYIRVTTKWSEEGLSKSGCRILSTPSVSVKIQGHHPSKRGISSKFAFQSRSIRRWINFQIKNRNFDWEKFHFLG